MTTTLDNSSNSGLNKLLPKSISSKRLRRKQDREASGLSQDDVSVFGHSQSSRETLESDGTRSGHIGGDEDEGTSQSHRSYESDGNDSTSKSSTFPPTAFDSIDLKDPRVGRSKTGLLPPQSSTRRSPSPGGRLKDIFKPKKSSGNSSSPERRPVSEPRQLLETRDEQQPTLSVDPEFTQKFPVLEPPAIAKVASPERRARVQPKVDTNIPPRTPPSGDKPAPVIVNTPPTPTEFPNRSGQSSPERKSFWGSPTSSSAAQSAANTLSNTSLNIGGNKGRSVSQNIQEQLEPDNTKDDAQPTPTAAEMADKKENRKSAVSTIGAGELSLSQLGLAEAPSLVASPVNARFPDASDTRARSESAPVDSPISPVDFAPDESFSRPRSLYEPVSRERTPPPPDSTGKENGVQRSSSIRSALRQNHRKRGSSVTTGTTIGAAIAAANNSLAHPNLSAPKLTGFAIATVLCKEKFWRTDVFMSRRAISASVVIFSVGQQPWS
ncbi:hypothetical protein FGSG_13614 [Fusarium graminearum PH-1]|uniref:hypothetical protein n=1 Tax=Gibberella zeae (strain ATCC MYA-4620 / CBS 123657 / FGSC 9075 / NRRL 31084 / PH-1) TaxID=229533 RepID=UPI00021F1F91|nr:hypothetical protein FGSG_13614 [Fusarium graminearum PH-1]ESU16212.1 hypothetical protein FGSG_13614 [Fusarium graminearum PH-1]|eukprot:XP_011328104.1 hypothetical protein FGSG_13614 [Fusarium graminearum PH-1]